MSSYYDQTYVNPDNIALAEEQLDNMADLFNRITETCYNKCILEDKTKLSESDASCIDNCVAKYLKASVKVKMTTEEIEANKNK